MFDKKQKNCVKHIHLVTDDGLHDGSYSKICFLFILYIKTCQLSISYKLKN